MCALSSTCLLVCVCVCFYIYLLYIYYCFYLFTFTHSNTYVCMCLRDTLRCCWTLLCFTSFFIAIKYVCSFCRPFCECNLCARLNTFRIHNRSTLWRRNNTRVMIIVIVHFMVFAVLTKCHCCHWCCCCHWQSSACACGSYSICVRACVYVCVRATKVCKYVFCGGLCVSRFTDGVNDGKL